MDTIGIEKIYQHFLECEQNISTDTRKNLKNTLFFCLKGARYDANLFVQVAIDSGASYVVTNNPDINHSKILRVENPNQTLLDLAKIHAQKIDCKLIAIGGSNGKTTTKELVYHALSSKYTTQATQGNFNNEIGVPLTILGLKNHTEFGIIELGTNHPGEMKRLCDVFKMDSGLLTNIGLEHLEGFHDIEAVAKEESELYLKAQLDGAHVFVNEDDPWLSNMSKRISQKSKYSIINKDSDIYVEVLNEMPTLELNVFVKGRFEQSLTAQIGGRYNASNIAAAISVGFYYNLNLSEITHAIQEYIPNNNRSQWLTDKHGTAILLDAYNANPSSMESGIRSFSTLAGSKALLLGDMLELGTHSQLEHRKIYELAISFNVDELFLVGNEFKRAAPEYPFTFETYETLLAWLDTHPISSKYVYIKGSRGITMEKCLEHFSMV
jgi:UDP-N-acetylmuramoyl-tripeptide--D-alanyl-D-alanine ligase